MYCNCFTTLKDELRPFSCSNLINYNIYYNWSIKIIKMNNQTLTEQQLYQIIPQLTISPQGIFKYILIRCYMDKILIATFIRGDKKFEYHSQNFDEFCKQLKKCGFTDLKKKEGKASASRNGNQYEFVCPGGGRIEHNYEGNKCSIYGYSQSYGYIDHQETKKIVIEHLNYSSEQIRLNEKDY